MCVCVLHVRVLSMCDYVVCNCVTFLQFYVSRVVTRNGAACHAAVLMQ